MARERSNGSGTYSNVDPFNAGEPVMPWDDPASADDVRAERVGTAPAPRERARDVRDEPPATPAPTAPDPEHMAPVRTTSAPIVPARTAEEEALADDHRQPQRTVPRHRGRKGGDGTGKPSGSGKGCGCRSFVGFVLLFLVVTWLFGDIAGCAFRLVTGAFDLNPSSTSSTTVDDNKAVGDAVTEHLDGILDDQSSIDLVKRDLGNRVENNFGYSADDLGIDADAYADWFLSKTSFRLRLATAYDDGTGFASFDVTVPQTFQVVSDFYDNASDYLASNKLYGSYGDGTTAVALTDEQKDQMRGFFADAVSNAELRENGYLSASLTKEGGSWSVDTGSMQDDLNYLLGSE